ncbi:MAG: hypothetical protein AAF613_08670 [Pseudomonadota bacterium]
MLRSTKRIGVLAAACLVLAALLASTAPAAAQGSDWDFETYEPEPFEDEGVREVVQVEDSQLDAVMAAYGADDDLQRERPVLEPESQAPYAPRERERNPIIEAIADFFAALFDAIGGVAGYILAAVLVAAIAYGLFLMFGDGLALRGKEKQAGDDPDISVAPDLRPEGGAARALLEDADALAAQGRFAEAVHMLLFRSIRDIQAKLDGGVPNSLTAREIGMLSKLPDAVRSALSPIIRIVERSFFGGRPVDEAGWTEARASYQRFAFGEAWS